MAEDTGTAVAEVPDSLKQTKFDSLEEAQGMNDKQVEFNRDLGIVEYKSGEKQSDKIYEVTDGLKHLPGGISLGVGQRFHPTERQVRTNALRGKARELTRSEARGAVRATVKSNIGVRAVEGLSKKMATYALEKGLTEDDFKGVDPEGEDDTFTKKQINDLIRAKRSGVTTDGDDD